jgi:Protein of unknown function (DUF1257)
MSHFTTIQTQIKDIDALREACAELGLELLANAEARGYGSQAQRGDFVIRLKGPYDVALHRQPEGAYRLSADLWEGHVEKELGQSYGRLLQLYAIHKAAREARKHGFSVRRTALQNGVVKLTLGAL